MPRQSISWASLGSVCACITWAVAFMLGTSQYAGAADLTAVKRVIGKEPAYKGKPRYCLLVFGAKADTWVWLVRDDQAVYVDRNGNGGLTGPGARSALNGIGFNINQIVERDGTIHKNLSVYCRPDGTFTMVLNDGDARAQYVGIALMERPSWGARAEDAPIIHFNGPMSFERYGPMPTIPRANANNRRLSLRLMLGSPGIGKGTFASYDEICTEQLGPIQADIVYPYQGRNGDLFKQRIELVPDG